MVGNIHHDSHVVLDHQDRHAKLLLQIENEAPDVLALLLIHAGDHFVEKQKLWRYRERAAKLDALLLAIGERADGMIANVLDFEKIDDLLDAFARLDLFGSRPTPENGGGQGTGA